MALRTRVRCSRGLGRTPSPPNADAGWLDPDGVHEASENWINDTPDFEMKPTDLISPPDLELVTDGESENSPARARHPLHRLRNGHDQNGIANPWPRPLPRRDYFVLPNVLN